MRLLSSAELVTLLRVLSTDSTLEQIDELFGKSFPKSEHFRLGYGLSVLLHDQMLTKAQRVVAFSILCDLFRSEQSGTNPFLLFFLDSVEHGKDQREQRYLVQLLFSAPSNRESAKKTPTEILRGLQWASSSEFSSVSLPDLNTLRQLYQDQSPMPTGFGGHGIRAVIPSPVSRGPEGEVLDQLRRLHLRDASADAQKDAEAAAVEAAVSAIADSIGIGGGSSGSGSGSSNGGGSGGVAAADGTAAASEARLGHLETSLTDEEAVEEGMYMETLAAASFSQLRPQFARPLPPMLPITDVELLWTHIEDAASILWDTSLVRRDDSGTGQVRICARSMPRPPPHTTFIPHTHAPCKVRDLMETAFSSPMNPPQQQQLIADIKADPRLVHQCALTPQRLPDLVENNPLVAIECMLCLMGSAQVHE